MPPTRQTSNDPIDRRAITAQTWTVAWEGALSGVRNSGNPSPVSLACRTFPGGGSRIARRPIRCSRTAASTTAPLGVVPGDLVTLTGCTDNSQCGLGEECVFGDGVSSAAAGLTVTGICVDPNRASAQTALCAEFLNSVRRYEVESPLANSLIIRPHLDEIVLSSLTPPVTRSRCHRDGRRDVRTAARTPPNDLTTANFNCETSYPGGGTGPRCLMPCT